MKKFSFIALFLTAVFSHSLLLAQHWDSLTVSGLTNTNNPVLRFAPVDYNVVWGIECYSFGWGVINPKLILTTDHGSTWNVTSPQILANYGMEAIYARDAQTAWAAVVDLNGGTNNGIYKTTDSGTSWQKQGNAYSGEGHPAIIYFYNKSDTGICIGTPRNNSFEVYTTIDGGTNWEQVNASNIPPADAGDLFPTRGAGAGNIFLFGTFLRKEYRSTDRGATWSKLDYTQAPSGAGVEFALSDHQNGLACTYFGDHVNRVASTSDGGLNWISPQDTIPANPSFFLLNNIAGIPGGYMVTSGNNIGLPEATTAGSAYTLDNGVNWVVLDHVPHELTSFSDDGWGWSGGVGGKVYYIYSELLPVELVSFTSPLPEQFSLEQNYPNPFNPSTKIKYSIPVSGVVTLKVFDVLGKEVATLVNEEKPAGNYEAEFNAPNLSSGVYLYTLQALPMGRQTESFTQTKKLLLLK